MNRGTEAIFGRLPGVITTAVGFSNGRKDYDQKDSVAPSYEEVSTGDTHHAEVVRVNFDPQVCCSYETKLGSQVRTQSSPELACHCPKCGLDCATQVVSYSELLECFWSCHDTTIRTWHRQNGTVSACPEDNLRIWQYRSAVFTHSAEQAHLADLAIAEHQKTVPVRSLRLRLSTVCDSL